MAKNQIFVFTKQNPNDDIHNGSLIQMWYDEQRRKIFKERFLNVSLNFPEAQKLRLSVAKMKSRWGSYRTDGTVVLHPDLIKASKQCIDYVLIHEFCHHYHKRHDEDFYRLLDKKMPDWKNIKEKLELRFAKN